MTRAGWKRLLTGTVALVVAVAFVGVGQMLNKWEPPVKPLPGWKIIRPPRAVSALVEKGGVVWAGGQAGVVAVDRQTGAVVEVLDPGFALEHVRALLVDREGSLWIGHRGGLTRCIGSACTTYGEDEGLPHPSVNALLEDDQGRIWAGTWRGVAVRDGEAWRALTAEDGLAVDHVEAMLQDHRGGMWFGSYVAPRGGISLLSEGEWTYFTTDDGLPHNNVTAFYQDPARSVWASTGFFDRGGAGRFELQQDQWALSQVLMKQDGLAGEKVYQILQDRHGALWFGSEYDGVARYDGACWSVFSTAQGLAHPEVMSLLEDVDGNVWLGTADGLTRVAADAVGQLTCEPD